MQRLDKALCDAGVSSRKEIKKLIKTGRVSVNGNTLVSAETKINGDEKILLDGEEVVLFRNVVLLMNKPAGFVTSTEDPRDRTVMELIPPKYLKLNVVPAGRLDKDTEGLLVFSNDGQLIHHLISPKSNIEKVYYAEYEGTAKEDDITAFCNGITLKDGTICKSAQLEILSSENGHGSCNVTVTEGMYHQVRRMMASRGLHITYLKRIKEGPYELRDLKTGEITEV